MTTRTMCTAVSGSGLPCALLVDHARPGGEYSHISIEGHQFDAPEVPEPREFGSIVRATCGPGLVGVLWQAAPWKGKHYWESETGAIDVWSELTDVEVLRVGIGELLPTSAAELSRMSVEAHIAKRAVEFARFCSLRSDCRMADGHQGGCMP